MTHHSRDSLTTATLLRAEQLPEGLEQAVMKMKVGEKAEIVIQPQYAFGAEASKQPQAVVPPQSTVVYTLELVDMEKVCRCSRRRMYRPRGWSRFFACQTCTE